MPRAFVGVMVRLKSDTAQRMVRTCLTLPKRKKDKFQVEVE